MATQSDDTHKDTSTKEDRLTLVVKIEEKKLQYKRERRPLSWYGTIAGIALIVTLAGVVSVGILGNSTYFGSFALAITIASGSIFCLLFIGFFSYKGIDSNYSEFFNGPERIIDLIALKEEIEDLQSQLRIFDEFLDQQRSALAHYREKLTQVIFQYERKANTNRRIHYTFQLCIIFFSLVVTALTSGFTGLIGFATIPWIAAIISFLVSLLTGITTLFRFRDRAFNLQQTADAIEFEVSAADLHIFDYKGKSDQDALHELAERAERLRDEQRKRQQQLEQASEHQIPSQQ